MDLGVCPNRGFEKAEGSGNKFTRFSDLRPKKPTTFMSISETRKWWKTSCCIHKPKVNGNWTQICEYWTRCSRIYLSICKIVWLYPGHPDINRNRPQTIGLHIQCIKHLDGLTPRLQRFKLAMLRYNYEVSYTPGKQLFTADTISRSPSAIAALQISKRNCRILFSR